MLNLRKAFPLALFALLVPFVAASNPQTVSATVDVLEPQCTVKMDNPHYSGDSGGVIAKARFICDTGVSQIYHDPSLELWGGCDSAPPTTPIGNAHGARGCSQFARNGYGQTNADARKTTTRYVPNPSAGDGKGLPRDKGYWRAYAVYSYPPGGDKFVAASPYVSNP